MTAVTLPKKILLNPAAGNAPLTRSSRRHKTSNIKHRMSLHGMEGIEEVREGRRLNLYKVQRPSDTTIFFIPGSLACHNIDMDIIKHLEDGFDVNIVAWDAYGSGKSDRKRDWDEAGNFIGHYSTENLFLDAYAILNKYTTEKNVLLGHSFGSALIARLVKRLQEERISRVTNVNISSCVLIGTAFKMPDGAHPVFMLPEALLSCLQPAMNEEAVRQALSLRSYENDELKTMSYKYGISNDMATVKAFFQQLKWATEEEWSSLKHVPVLVLQGKEDQITNVDNALLLYERIIATEEYRGRLSSFKIIPDAGHMVMYEQPSLTNSFIVEFLQGLNILQERIETALPGS